MNSSVMKGISFLEPSKGRLTKSWKEKSSSASYFLHQVEYIEMFHNVEFIQIARNSNEKINSLQSASEDESEDDVEPDNLSQQQKDSSEMLEVHDVYNGNVSQENVIDSISSAHDDNVNKVNGQEQNVQTQFNEISQDFNSLPESCPIEEAMETSHETLSEAPNDKESSNQQNILNNSADNELNPKLHDTESFPSQRKRKLTELLEDCRLVDGPVKKDTPVDKNARKVFGDFTPKSRISSQPYEITCSRNSQRSQYLEYGMFLRSFDGYYKTDSNSEKRIAEAIKDRQKQVSQLQIYEPLFENLDNVPEWDVNTPIPAKNSLTRRHIEQLKKGMKNGKLYNISRFQIKKMFPRLPKFEYQQDEKTGNFYQCPLCPKKSQLICHLYQHLEKDHSSSLLQCIKCSRMYCCTRYAEAHRLRKCYKLGLKSLSPLNAKKVNNRGK